jgi:hypothetical protein
MPSIINSNDLEELIDISNEFVSTNDINEYIFDIKETIYYFIEEYLESNICIYKDKHFNDFVFNHVKTIIDEFYPTLYNDITNITEFIESSLQYYFTIRIPRSYESSIILKKPNIKKMDDLLVSYKNMEQPEQLTTEWYNFRWNLLTASNIWKALDTESSRNNLILGKCLPIDTKKYNSVNINSPFHNGHKYEPLSTMLYEYDYDTIVGEFGCIRHPTIDFLGASPDGINIKRDNLRYGRGLEIKNPVNRKLTGIPKKDYWIQMQLQMEVWDLDEIDFLETCFKEYESEEEFNNDGETFNFTKNNKRKGIIVQFYNGSKPVYKYPPINISKNDYEKWYDTILQESENLNWIKNIYWRLDEESCVLVTRNKKWFNAVLPEFKKVWDTILKERKEGYEHRKPKKRQKREKKAKPNKTINIDTMNYLFEEIPDSPKIDKDNVVIKIRTQSFEESTN